MWIAQGYPGYRNFKRIAEWVSGVGINLTAVKIAKTAKTAKMEKTAKTEKTSVIQ
jgi:hypothetical protein